MCVCVCVCVCVKEIEKHINQKMINILWKVNVKTFQF